MNGAIKITKSFSLTLIGAFLVASCSSIPEGYRLDPAAPEATIPVVEFVPSTERDQYDEIHLSTCELGMNARSVEANTQACINKFKMQAGSMNADMILLQSAQAGQTRADLAFFIPGGHCANCVKLKAIFLRTKKKLAAK